MRAAGNPEVTRSERAGGAARPGSAPCWGGTSLGLRSQAGRQRRFFMQHKCGGLLPADVPMKRGTISYLILVIREILRGGMVRRHRNNQQM